MIKRGRNYHQKWVIEEWNGDEWEKVSSEMKKKGSAGPPPGYTGAKGKAKSGERNLMNRDLEM